MPTKLYVGNLAYSVTNEDLEGLFSQAGKVDSAVVVVKVLGTVARFWIRRNG